VRGRRRRCGRRCGRTGVLGPRCPLRSPRAHRSSGFDGTRGPRIAGSRCDPLRSGPPRRRCRASSSPCCSPPCRPRRAVVTIYRAPRRSGRLLRARARDRGERDLCQPNRHDPAARSASTRGPEARGVLSRCSARLAGWPTHRRRATSEGSAAAWSRRRDSGLLKPCSSPSADDATGPRG
jgi:hypothetical protein